MWVKFVQTLEVRTMLTRAPTKQLKAKTSFSLLSNFHSAILYTLTFYFVGVSKFCSISMKSINRNFSNNIGFTKVSFVNKQGYSQQS